LAKEVDIEVINRNWNWKHVGMLALVAIACYWPFSLGIFSAKNDNIICFLPTRFHVSEALRAGELPLWTPYMYLGFPLHGDMQGGAWNPVVWMLSIFSRYNLTSMHAEIILAIFFAAAGMYRLLSTQFLAPTVRLAASIVFALCGFVTDVAGSNLPFLWAAGGICFSAAYYYELLRKPGIRYAIRTGLAFSFFFLTAYPSFFILTAYCCLAALILKLILQFRSQKDNGNLIPLLKMHLLAVLIFGGLCAPAIISYLQVLPLYARANGVTPYEATANSFNIRCSLSFLFPPAQVKDISTAGTDLISKNAYFGVYFLILSLLSVKLARRPFIGFVLAGMTFFFLFSLGGATPLRAWCYHLLPLLDTFRHPSNARLFVIVGGILTGAIGWQYLLNNKREKAFFIQLLFGTIGLSMAALLVAIPGSKWTALNLAGPSFRLAIKSFLDAISFSELLTISVIIQVAFLVFMILGIAKAWRLRFLSALIVANAVLMAQLALPFTGVSKISPSAINSFLKNSPEGFPPRPLEPIARSSAEMLSNFETIGFSGFYSKRIETTTKTYTPTFLSSIKNFSRDTAAWNRSQANAFFYSASTGTAHVEVSSMSCNEFTFRVNSPAGDSFCLQQAWVKGWKATVDGSAVPISKKDGALQQVFVPAGRHEVHFSYQPRFIITACTLALLTIVLLLLSLFIRKWRHA